MDDPREYLLNGELTEGELECDCDGENWHTQNDGDVVAKEVTENEYVHDRRETNSGSGLDQGRTY